MKVVMCQLNTWVGDIAGNTAKVLASVTTDPASDAPRLFVFPELTLTGYPPEDLLLRPALGEQVDEAIEHLKRELPSQAWVLIGYPRKQDGKLFGCYEAQDRWGRPVLLFRNEWKVTQLKDTEEEHGLGLMPCATAPELE